MLNEKSEMFKCSSGTRNSFLRTKPVGRRKLTLEFGKSHPFTLGAELELQILNRETYELSSSSPLILENVGGSELIKAEIYQSMIEIITGVCQNAHQIKEDLGVAFSELLTASKNLNLCFAGAGTHPSAIYQDSLIFPCDRYQKVLKNHQWIAKRLLIFGLHVHVGMRNGDHAVQTTNALLHYLPLFLALSASSPFYKGEDTNLASSRITFFEALPTGGHPYTFYNWSEFNEIYSTLLKSGSIFSPKDLWWDIRPSPMLGTIEIRICDAPGTLSECGAIAALVHLLCLKIDQEISNGENPKPPPDWLLRENKWRVARNGVRAELIVNESGSIKSLTTVLNETIESLEIHIQNNKYESQMSLLKKIALHGSGADRQRKLFRKTEQFKMVSESLVQELESDRTNWSLQREKKTKPNLKKRGKECA
ncbi:MAG: hypothetical protein B7Y39_16375 [Bdellovibrio sp. 28-41-41]|nr:MAG: hypothetical protein B7Y39_16375 [Bdellovibrio sp. 28-41-41]